MKSIVFTQCFSPGSFRNLRIFFSGKSCFLFFLIFNNELFVCSFLSGLPSSGSAWMRKKRSERCIPSMEKVTSVENWARCG